MLHDFPEEHLLDGRYCFFDYDPEGIMEALSDLDMDRCRVTVMYPNAPHCTETEHWFQAPHSPVTQSVIALCRRHKSNHHRLELHDFG